MPSHWTYSDFASEDDLRQGDIIQRTNALIDFLSGIHSHFCDERYVAFVVSTQSCDLVRRKDRNRKCKAQHISLAVVAELEPLLPTLLHDICGTEVNGVYQSDKKFLAEQLLVRIVNQNEQALGLFYLYPDADVGIAAHAVALARMTFALDQEQYNLIAQSRCGRLAPEYANKFGWLTGNLYSRVATPDWEDQTDDQKASINLARQILSSITENDGQNWVPSHLIRAAVESGIALDKLAPSNILNEVKRFAPPEPIKVVTERLRDISRELIIRDKLRFMLLEDAEFRKFCLQALQIEIISEASSVSFEMIHYNLMKDELFAISLADQLCELFQRSFRVNPSSPVEEFVSRVLEAKGLSKIALSRIQEVVGGLEDSDNIDWDSYIARISNTCCFARIPWNAFVESIENDDGFRRIETVVNRLKNDQVLRSAINRR